MADIQRGRRLVSKQAQEIYFNALNFSVNSLDWQKCFDNSTKELIEMLRRSVMTLGTSIHEELCVNTPSKDENDRFILEGNRWATLRELMEIYQKITNREGQTILKDLSQAGYINSVRKDIDTILDKAEESIQTYSLRNEFEDWAKDGVLALPLQNFDMMYNMIKRLANANFYGQGLPESLEDDGFFDAFNKLFESIGSQLGEQDNFYANNGSESVSFRDAYKSFPFYKHFVDNPSVQLKKMFTEVIKAMVRGQLQTNAAKV